MTPTSSPSWKRSDPTGISAGLCGSRVAGNLRNTASLELGRLQPFLDAPGLTIMSVYPLHMAINSPDFQYSRSLKDKPTRKEMIAFAKESIAKVRHDGPGVATFFEEILQYVKGKGYLINTLEELNQMITDA